MSTRVLRYALLALACTAVACDEKLSSIAGPTPNLEPTFASIQHDIFEATDSAGRTACTQCHTSTGRNPSGGMNLNPDVAYDQIVNIAARAKPTAMRIVPGDPNNSYLYLKLTGGAGITGNRMPNNGPPYLTDGQLLIIKRWIENGAPRN
jgi:mono/diheme cytochrome c family protein